MSEIRKLARIVRVDSVENIENADALDLVKIGGWQCVVRKGAFEAGDKGAYIEIDSVLPESDPQWAPFMARSVRNCWRENGERYRGHVVRSVKLRGVLSQGLLLGAEFFEGIDHVEVGDDFTGRLGIIKYELPPNNNTNAPQAGIFPDHLVPKTDAERVQNLQGFFEQLNPDEWYPTEKVDGTSLTVSMEGSIVRVSSRNWELQEGENLYWQSARELIPYLRPGLSIQAEIFGQGIQGNPLSLSTRSVAVFSQYDVVEGYMPRDRWPPGLEYFAVEKLSLRLPKSIAEAIAQADKLPSVYNSAKQAEGIVWHHKSGRRFAALGGRACFKVINNDWLLRHK